MPVSLALCPETYISCFKAIQLLNRFYSFVASRAQALDKNICILESITIWRVKIREREMIKAMCIIAACAFKVYVLIGMRFFFVVMCTKREF